MNSILFESLESHYRQQQSEKIWIKNNVNCRKLDAMNVNVHWHINSVLLLYYRITVYFYIIELWYVFQAINRKIQLYYF